MQNEKALEEMLFRRHAEVCRCFSSPVRLRLLALLGEGEAPVGALARRAGVSLANCSQHLRLMRERGVVKSRREGSGVLYSLANPKILKAFAIMRELVLDSIREEARLVDVE